MWHKALRIRDLLSWLRQVHSSIYNILYHHFINIILVWLSFMCSRVDGCCTLTLIHPGEVKVDLANFDVKFRAKFLYNVLFFLDVFLQKHLPNLYKLLTWHQKTMFWWPFWHPFWSFFVRTSVTLLLCRHPRFRPVLLLLQTTWVQEKSRRAMVRSVVQRQLNSDQFLVPGQVECGGRRVLSRAVC